jgi:hypothetical protein
MESPRGEKSQTPLTSSEIFLTPLNSVTSQSPPSLPSLSGFQLPVDQDSPLPSHASFRSSLGDSPWAENTMVTHLSLPPLKLTLGWQTPQKLKKMNAGHRKSYSTGMVLPPSFPSHSGSIGVRRRPFSSYSGRISLG